MKKLLLSLGIAIMLFTPMAVSSQTEPTVEARLDRLECTVYGENCPEPTPTPDPTPDPTPTPTPTPDPTPDPDECDGVDVVAPASIQAAVNNNPAGTDFCLSGTFNQASPVVPKNGNDFIGAHVRGANGNDTGFDLRIGQDDGVENVTFRDVEMSNFDLRSINCWLGTTIVGGHYHDNGRNAFGCSLRGHPGVVTVDGVRVTSNGDPSESGGGAGGVKFVNGDFVVRDSHIEANIGNGIWCDLDCRSLTVTGTTVLGSTRKGIFFEISKGPFRAIGNVVQKNNCSPDYWGNGNPECDLPNGTFGPQSAGAPGGGIAANSSCPANSAQCVIRDNVLGGNMVAGINFRDDARPAGSNAGVGYDQPFNILVELNQMNGDELRNCQLTGIICRNNN